MKTITKSKQVKIKDDKIIKSKSTILHLQGKALDNINALQAAYYSKFFEEISKDDAVNILIGKIPHEALKEYIKIIISELTPT